MLHRLGIQRCRPWWLLGLLGCLLPLQAALAGVDEDLKALVESKQSAAAYALGEAHPEKLGDPDFDFYFGIAAIDQGHAGQGVLALERYILLFPGNLSARAQLARGYFALGDDALAKAEFEDLQRENPPESVSAIIDQYLAALKVRAANYSTTKSAYVEAGTGFDSNTNSGAGGADINVPIFGTVTLQPAAQKVSSWYQSLAAGGQVSTPLSPGFALFGGGDIYAKQNDKESAQAFNVATYSANGGLSFFKDKDLFRLTLAWNDLELDGTRYLQVASVTGEWTHQIDELQSITGDLQYAHLTYPTQTIRDSDIPTLDVSYRRALTLPWATTVSVGATYGQEENSLAENLARDIYGVRAGVSISPLPKWVFSAVLSYQENNYEAPEPLISVTRRDHYGSLDLLASYHLTRQASIRAEALLSTNHSNLELFAYNRNVVAVKLHYDFQ